MGLENQNFVQHLFYYFPFKQRHLFVSNKYLSFFGKRTQCH